MTRKTVSSAVEAEVAIKSRRRCALCAFVDQNLSERPGQIAHLNGDHSDSRFENLVWLCLEHHDKFDSTTRQTKNYTPAEVKHYRDELYQLYRSSEYSDNDLADVRNFFRQYCRLFNYIFSEYGELAFGINLDAKEEMSDLTAYWYTNSTRSFNSSVREMQDHIIDNLAGILSIYEIGKYDLVGNRIQYMMRDFGRNTLDMKRKQAKEFVDSILSYYRRLEEIAVK